MADRNPDNPIITIIIPTYNRPEMLKICIKGVLKQTVKNWKMYVIGDCCNDDTQVTVEEFKDPRITYYNNPFRFGEQGGGNSIGIALADTEYLAFLNHDDIWTPNHLEVSIKALENNQTNFYIGKCLITDEYEGSIPTFKFTSNKNRKPFWAYITSNDLFEPTSSWVLKTSLAKKIKYWKFSSNLYRYPIQDYLIRAWRKKAKFEFGTIITCIRLNNHSKKNISIYLQLDSRTDYLNRLVNNLDELIQKTNNKSLIEIPFTKSYRVGSNKSRKFIYRILHDIFVNKLTAYLYLQTGIDSYNILNLFLLIKKGERSKYMLKHRTGEILKEMIDIESVAEKAKKLIQQK